jgi:oligopeptide/dipeptide ABC transporter ATP-binding protein
MAAHEPPILEVRDLRTYFFPDEGTVKAVDGVSFEVYAGRTLGIVGESGCGKSVTAKSILRIVERPGRIVDGEIHLRAPGGNGRAATVDLVKLDPSGAEIRGIRGGDIGLVFQEPMTSFSPVHTIGNQMVETIRLHTRVEKAAARERAIEMLRLVGIPKPERRIDEYAFQLSGGLRQRAMIAVALSCHPRILIADEPTTALDVTIQAQILELMKSLTLRLNVALIVITHNLGVVARYASRVNVMYAGRIVEAGSADSVYHNPRHPYTVALLRSVPRLDLPRRARLDPVDGQPPDLTRLDGGCAFRPRCRFAIDKCSEARPPLEGVGEAGHFAACFRSSELLAALDVAA